MFELDLLGDLLISHLELAEEDGTVLRPSSINYRQNLSLILPDQSKILDRTIILFTDRSIKGNIREQGDEVETTDGVNEVFVGIDSD